MIMKSWWPITKLKQNRYTTIAAMDAFVYNKTIRRITLLILDQRIHNDADLVNVPWANDERRDQRRDQRQINVHLRFAISRRDDLS